MYTKEGINVNTFNLLFNEIYKSKNDNLTNTAVIMAIDYFSLDEEEQLKVFDKKYHFDFKQDEDGFYIFKYEDIEFKFNLLSEVLEFKNPDNNPLKKELVSRERYSKCHDKSLLLVYLDNTSIITGLENLSGDLILHSVICKKEDDGKEYIMDYSKNLFMERSLYLKLHDFKILQELNNKTYYLDIENINKLAPFDSRIYLVFREELIRDFNKNKQVLGLKLND